jgi:HSP20 family protein
MTSVRFYPLVDINTLHRQMNRLFEDLNTGDNSNFTTIKPAVELIDEEDNLILHVIVPGVDKKDFDINVTRETVNFSGEYRPNQDNKDKSYYISEFNYGKFERTIKLPVPIQNDKVTANYINGILTLTLPKLEEAKNKIFKVNLGAEK